MAELPLIAGCNMYGQFVIGNRGELRGTGVAAPRWKTIFIEWPLGRREIPKKNKGYSLPGGGAKFANDCKRCLVQW